MVWVWDLITRHLFCPSLSCWFAWMIFSTGCNKVNDLTTMLGPGRQKLDRSLSHPACIFCMYTFTFAVKSLHDFGSSMTLQSLLSSYDFFLNGFLQTVFALNTSLFVMVCILLACQIYVTFRNLCNAPYEVFVASKKFKHRRLRFLSYQVFASLRVWTPFSLSYLSSLSFSLSFCAFRYFHINMTIVWADVMFGKHIFR